MNLQVMGTIEEEPDVPEHSVNRKLPKAGTQQELPKLERPNPAKVSYDEKPPEFQRNSPIQSARDYRTSTGETRFLRFFSVRKPKKVEEVPKPPQEHLIYRGRWLGLGEEDDEERTRNQEKLQDKSGPRNQETLLKNKKKKKKKAGMPPELRHQLKNIIVY